MNAVLNNPYRILGLLVETSAVKQKEQISRLKGFLDRDQIPLKDFSFPIFGNLSRTLDTVIEASSKLDSNKDKINAALFWFYTGNPNSDILAFDAVKDGQCEQAVSIWSDLISIGEVTRLNASAYNNLSTLYLSGISKGTTSYEDLIEKGVTLKLKFLESEFNKDLIKLTTDGTFEITKKDLQIMFLNHLQSELENNEIMISGKLLNIIMSQEFSAKENFLKMYGQKIVKEIENKIKEANKKSKANKNLAGEYGKELYDTTKNQLNQIKTLVGLSDFNYINISDKLANGILQCSISVFNHFHNTDMEVGEMAIDLNKKADSIALGNVVKDRINESTKIVEKYIKDWKTRRKLSDAKNDIKNITEALEKFQMKDHTISQATNFANECKPLLKSLKLKLGEEDKIYLTISTLVATNIQNVIISTVNEAVEKRNKYVNYYNFLNDPFCRLAIFMRLDNCSDSDDLYSPEYSLEMLRNVISQAWHATVAFEYFDMSRKESVQYYKYRTSLLELYKQINQVFLYFKNTPVNKWVNPLIGLVL